MTIRVTPGLAGELEAIVGRLADGYPDDLPAPTRTDVARAALSRGIAVLLAELAERDAKR